MKKSADRRLWLVQVSDNLSDLSNSKTSKIDLVLLYSVRYANLSRENFELSERPFFPNLKYFMPSKFFILINQIKFFILLLIKNRIHYLSTYSRYVESKKDCIQNKLGNSRAGLLRGEILAKRINSRKFSVVKD